MDFRHYHTPPKPVSTRVCCPVCHEAVYSRGNIHPQCAVYQSESPRPKKQPLPVANFAAGAEQAADRAPAFLSNPPNLEISSTPHNSAH
jgi:hypothetical protein